MVTHFPVGMGQTEKMRKLEGSSEATFSTSEKQVRALNLYTWITSKTHLNFQN